MKLKIQKIKFIRNILIGIVALIIVAFIINIAPGYKRDKYSNVINLVIGDSNVTEKLKKPIYRDEEGALYISKEDIQELLDKTIYYDETENMIIATSEVSVAAMKIGENKVNINGATSDTLSTIIYYDNTMYIPIKEMEIVYNIETKYLEDKHILVIDKLNDGMIKAEAESKTKIKFKPRGLSKKVGELNAGDTVSAFYTTSKGWRLIRTETGIIGYVKANVLTNEYILRQDMKQETETRKINTSIDDNTLLNIEGESIVIKDLLKITQEGILLKNVDFTNDNKDTKVFSNLELEDMNIENYTSRTKLIKNISSIAMKNEIKGINIILPDEDDINIQRFVIELAPRLKEIGIDTNIVTNKNINEDVYTGIVKYIISK